MLGLMLVLLLQILLFSRSDQEMGLFGVSRCYGSITMSGLDLDSWWKQKEGLQIWCGSESIF